MNLNSNAGDGSSKGLRWDPRVILLTYPGSPDVALEKFTSNLWSGYSEIGVSEFLACKPDFDQLLAAMVIKCDLFPLSGHLFEFARDVRRLNSRGILNSVNRGIMLEALSFSGRPKLLPDPVDFLSLATVYDKMDAVRSLARVRRSEEALSILKKLGSAIDDLSYRCLLADILISKGAYRQLIASLDRFRSYLPPRYLKLLGRSYAVIGAAEEAIDIFECLPEYDYFRMLNVPRLRAGKAIDSVHWDRSVSKKLHYSFDFNGVTKPLDLEFSKYLKRLAPKIPWLAKNKILRAR